MLSIQRRRQSGQALVAAAFGLVVLLGAAGLAIDMGYLRYQRRLQQSAADSAALAGAAEAAAGNATTAAREDAKLNGFDYTKPGITVNVNPNFAFGGKTGVQVQVSALQPTFFMRVFGVNNATISTVAVALNASAINCVYALNDVGTALSNSGTLTANGAHPCGILDDSDLVNTGDIHAASVGVHGTAPASGIFPPAVTGIVPAADPLYRLTPPGTGAPCASGPNPGDDGIMQGATGIAPTKSFTLNPGKYCKGLVITNRANVTFTPGLYIVTGNLLPGGINFNGTGTVTGNGVTFYNSGSSGPVQINNSGGAENMTLHAQTTGALAGILFYQRPTNTQAATIDGEGTSVLRGTLYFPGATLHLSDTAAAQYTMAVAKSLTLSGTVHFASDFSSLPGGSPIKNAVLVE